MDVLRALDVRVFVVPTAPWLVMYRGSVRQAETVPRRLLSLLTVSPDWVPLDVSCPMFTHTSADVASTARLETAGKACVRQTVCAKWAKSIQDLSVIMVKVDGALKVEEVIKITKAQKAAAAGGRIDGFYKPKAEEAQLVSVAVAVVLPLLGLPLRVPPGCRAALQMGPILGLANLRQLLCPLPIFLCLFCFSFKAIKAATLSVSATADDVLVLQPVACTM